jgi:hypothetical protein
MSNTDQICAQRLYLTADKKLVPEGDKRAAFLYASLGDIIPGEAAAKFGLKDGALPAKKAVKQEGSDKQPSAPAAKPKAPAAKPKAPAETKPKAPAETKVA